MFWRPATGTESLINAEKVPSSYQLYHRIHFALCIASTYEDGLTEAQKTLRAVRITALYLPTLHKRTFYLIWMQINMSYR